MPSTHTLARPPSISAGWLKLDGPLNKALQPFVLERGGGQKRKELGIGQRSSQDGYIRSSKLNMNGQFESESDFDLLVSKGGKMKDASDVTDTSSEDPEDERMARMTAAFKTIIEVCMS
jgi:hypothetical protein